MGQTLTNGIYLPDEGEVRCYAGLASNWTTLDSVVGGYRAHIANEDIHITSAERNKWDNGVSQAYVLRYANTSLTALGTVAFSALDNTDNVKIGDKVLDSEGKLFALTAVDTANSSATLSALLIDLSKDSDLSNYYTKGETDNLLSSKADDSGVVHKSGAETIAGVKTFSAIPIFATFDGISFRCAHNSNAYVTFRNATQANPGSIILSANDGTTGTAIHLVDKTLIPYTSGDIDLGTKTRKWKSLNGINPGALSLPDLSAGVDISGYITAGSNHNEYTPTVDGWISVTIKKTNTTGALALFIYQGYICNSYFGNTSLPNESEFSGMASIPVKAGIVVNIDTKGANTYIYSAKFYPCAGNV